MEKSIDEKLQEAREEGFNDRVSYENCIDRVKKGLRLIREGKIPQNVTDTGVDFFEMSVKRLYQKARRISSKYSDPNEERSMELNRLDILVSRACNGVKNGG